MVSIYIEKDSSSYVTRCMRRDYQILNDLNAIWWDSVTGEEITQIEQADIEASGTLGQVGKDVAPERLSRAMIL